MAEAGALPWLRLESTLMAVSRSLRRAYDAGLAHLSLNLTEAMLLAYVEERGPVSQSQLAEALGLGRAAVGIVIDGLHERGLVTREADPGDRRVWLVALTGEGRELCADIAAADRELREQVRAGLSRAERQQFVRLLLRLQDNCAALAAKGRAASTAKTG